jgi:hypothetical protein
MEALRDDWFAAADMVSQQRIYRDMQMLAFGRCPFTPPASSTSQPLFDSI